MIRNINTFTSLSQIRSTKQRFVKKKNVRGIRYKPRGDWFSFGKVWKLSFLCSYKQTLLLSRLTRACTALNVLRYPPERQSHVNMRMTDSGSYTKLFISLYKIWNFFFFLQKRIDLLQEAFIHTPEARDGCFNMNVRFI